MNAKEKEKSKRGKAIIGIAIAVIMFATLMTMIPAVSATDVTDQYLSYRQPGYPGKQFLVNPAFVAIDIANESLCTGTMSEHYPDWPTDSIKIGQELIFNNTNKTDVVLIEGIPDTNTDGEAFSSSAFVTKTVRDVNGVPGNDKTISGIYFDTSSMKKAGTYILSCPAEHLKQTLSVTKPVIPIELKVASDVVSTITTGTRLRLDCSGISDLDPNDCVDLEIIDPDGHQIKTWNGSGVPQYFDEINVSTLIEYGSTNETKQIDTTNWILGTYTFHIVTEEENARGLYLESETKTLKVLKGGVYIDIDRTEVGELVPVTVTVTGVYRHIIHVEATVGVENVEFEEGKGDFSDTFNPLRGKYGVYGFDVRMDEDGRMEFSVKFRDTGSYTIEVRDYGVDGIPGTADDKSNWWDSEDVKVEKHVTFNMSPAVTIGEDLEIRGTTDAGDYIDIAIDNCIVYTGIPVEYDMTFEVDLPTPETPGTGTPGTITIKAFIRSAGEPPPEIGKDVTNWDDDGQTLILLTSGSWTVDISPKGVAQGDEFTVEGTAEGSDFVDIVTIAPKGGSGRGINPYNIPSVPGISCDSSAVSDDYSFFLKNLYVDQDADTGKYLVIVVSPGRNGVYDKINDDHLFGAAFEAEYGPIEDLASKTQEQILSIIKDETVESPGSDDLIWTGYINVTLIPYAYLNASISKSTVSPGDSFEVCGDASTDYVEIVAVSPKGGNGTGLDGLYGVSIYTVPIFNPEETGSYKIHAFINSKTTENLTTVNGTSNRENGTVVVINGTGPEDGIAYNFYKRIKVDSGADTGNYTIIVLTPGIDGIYGNSSYKYIDSILDLDGAGPELGAIDVSNKTQAEIVSIIKEATTEQAGSDDLIWSGNIVVTQFGIFDTGSSPNPYPSIPGTYNGTIMPSHDINVSKLYTYPCPGTGGHTEYIEIYENGELIANGTWNGYIGDYHNLTLHNVSGAQYVMLLEEHKYNYTIRTGSYPQIIHGKSKDVTGGVINCTEFIDANGKEYNDWIPAIRLE